MTIHLKLCTWNYVTPKNLYNVNTSSKSIRFLLLALISFFSLTNGLCVQNFVFVCFAALLYVNNEQYKTKLKHHYSCIRCACRLITMAMFVRLFWKGKSDDNFHTIANPVNAIYVPSKGKNIKIKHTYICVAIENTEVNRKSFPENFKWYKV